MRVGDFFVELGVQADSASLRDFTHALGEIPLKAISIVGALSAIAYGLKSMTSNAMDTAVELQQFSSMTGLSIDELQKWQRAAKQMNVDGKVVQSSIIGVQNAINAIKTNRGNYEPFTMLGIDPWTATPTSAMNQVRELIRSKKYPIEMILGYAQQMGIAPEMASALSVSVDEFERMSKVAAGMDTTQLKEFLKTKKDLVEFGQTLEQVSINIAASIARIVNSFQVLPKVTEIIKDITAFIDSPKPWEGKGPTKGPGDKFIDWIKSIQTPSFQDAAVPQGIAGSIREGLSNAGGLTGDKNQTINQNVTINNHGADPIQTSTETVRQLKNMQNKHADQYFGVPEQ